MNLKSKIIYISFYSFALLILILTGDVKIVHIGNFWRSYLDIIKRHSTEEYKIYCHKKYR